MRDILLVGCARERSRRINNKMTRQFDNTCLYKIYLDKLEKISRMKHPFNNITMAICKQDEKLWDMSKNSKIQITKRTKYSVSDKVQNISDVHFYLNRFDEEYVMFVNGCFPFLKVESVIDAANYFIKAEELKSLTCVTPRYNYFWDSETYRPINNLDKENIHTTNCKPVLESIQCFHICNRQKLLDNNYLWDFTKGNPYLYVVGDESEALDIDTEFEFEICSALWRKRNEK